MPYAASRASFHVRFSPSRSSRIVSGQFFLGLPLPFFPPGTQYMTYFALPSSLILAPWSSHVYLLLLMMQPNSSWPVFSLITVFRILPLQETCRILFSHLQWCATSSLLPFATVINRSQLHIEACSTQWTHTYYSRTQVTTLHPLLFQFSPIFQRQCLLCPFVFWFPCRSCHLMSARSPSCRNLSPPLIVNSNNLLEPRIKSFYLDPVAILLFPYFHNLFLVWIDCKPTFAASAWTLSVKCFIPSPGDHMFIILH